MAAGLLTAGVTDIKTTAAAVGIAGVSALLPDVDSPDSKLGRMLPIIPRLLKTVVGHRGPLHSLVAAAGAFGLSFLLFHQLDVSFLVFAGYASHLVMDALNPEGVPVLWPLDWHFGIPLTHTGSIIERLVIIPAEAVALCWLLYPAVASSLHRLI